MDCKFISQTTDLVRLRINKDFGIKWENNWYKCVAVKVYHNSNNSQNSVAWSCSNHYNPTLVTSRNWETKTKSCACSGCDILSWDWVSICLLVFPVQILLLAQTTIQSYKKSTGILFANSSNETRNSEARLPSNLQSSLDSFLRLL